MTVVELFAGIGGFGLGLTRAGMKVVAQVENDKACNEVLEERWPSSGLTTCGKRGDTICHCATCLSAGSHAKTCPLPGSVQVYRESEAGFSSSLFALHASCVPLGWCLKTYPDFYRLTKDAISPSSCFR